jgi:acyl-coenzyme A synthetase/AMP-(fatty) acid ligase
LYVLEQICRTAQVEPEKLALAVNGVGVGHGRFWRLIEACRRALGPDLPDHGVAIVSADSILDGWILCLALRSLGLDACVIREPAQAALFDGLDVACVIGLTNESRPPAPALAGAISLSLDSPSRAAIDEAQPLPPLPEDLRAGGQVVLTSGTTGVGKRVLSTVGSEAARIEERSDRYRDLAGFRQQGPDTVLCIFNLALWTAAGHSRPVLTWCLGGGVVAWDQDDAFQRALEWPGITHALATPAFLAELARLPAGAFPYSSDMQLIVVAGAVSPALARATRERLTPRILINLSSTEAGGWARTIVETDEDLRWYRLDPKRRVEVVDDADQPLPAGALGRVRVALREGGPTGYLEDPETTAEFFRAGWFYPGDLGVLDGKGRLALYGRTTDIVHINGNKFPAEPWERAILEALECDGVCLLSGSWTSEAEELHLFIESRKPVTGEALTRAVQSTLSGFAGVLVHKVERLPRTPSGKIRRIALAQALQDAAAQA